MLCRVILSVAVYSDKDVISGDEIAALINQNKEMFTVPVSYAAVVGRLSYIQMLIAILYNRKLYEGNS